MKNYHYKTLGLEEGATLDEIKKAYKLYASKYHPDKHQGDEFFKEQFQKIREAYEFLLNNYEYPIPEIISFYASKKEISIGEFVDVYWETEYTQKCDILIDMGTKILTYENVGVSGTRRFKISDIKDYLDIYLIAFDLDGRENFKSKIHLQKTTRSKPIQTSMSETYTNEQKIDERINNEESGWLSQLSFSNGFFVNFIVFAFVCFLPFQLLFFLFISLYRIFVEETMTFADVFIEQKSIMDGGSETIYFMFITPTLIYLSILIYNHFKK